MTIHADGPRMVERRRIIQKHQCGAWRILYLGQSYLVDVAPRIGVFVTNPHSVHLESRRYFKCRPDDFVASPGRGVAGGGGLNYQPAQAAAHSRVYGVERYVDAGIPRQQAEVVNPHYLAGGGWLCWFVCHIVPSFWPDLTGCGKGRRNNR